MLHSIIAVSGADRLGFLQGQLTQDVAAVSAFRGLAAAWCSPKGRVIVTCRIFAQGEALYLALPSRSTESVLKRLHMYRLRADVELAVTTDYVFAAFATVDAPDESDLAHTTIPFETDFVEVFGNRHAVTAAGFDLNAQLTDEAWRAARCAAGLVDIDTENTELYTPHMLNLDLTDAVNFNKGCYTGQEVVARTEHLGKVKRRVARYRSAAGAPAVGDEVQHDGQAAGRVVNAAGAEVLAVVPVALHAQALSCGSTELTPAPLPYAIKDQA